jgi:hypothetical protein
MSGSALFPQRLADLTGLPVSARRYQETTALGAALFCWRPGAAVFGSVGDAAKARPEAEDLAPAWPGGSARLGSPWREAVGPLTGLTAGASRGTLPLQRRRVMADGSLVSVHSLKGRVSEAEWATRVDLAAL